MVTYGDMDDGLGRQILDWGNSCQHCGQDLLYHGRHMWICACSRWRQMGHLPQMCTLESIHDRQTHKDHTLDGRGDVHRWMEWAGSLRTVQAG